jgi:Rhodanese-like domain
MRLADMKEGQWVHLPKDKTIIVLCWTGMRGKVTATYLKSLGFNALYLEGGIEKWTQSKKIFNGTTEFNDIYTDRRYHKFLTKEQYESIKENEGLVLDVRT